MCPGDSDCDVKTVAVDNNVELVVIARGYLEYIPGFPR